MQIPEPFPEGSDSAGWGSCILLDTPGPTRFEHHLVDHLGQPPQFMRWERNPEGALTHPVHCTLNGSL